MAQTSSSRSAGLLIDFTAARSDVRSEAPMNTSWSCSCACCGIPAVHERARRVICLQREPRQLLYRRGSGLWRGAASSAGISSGATVAYPAMLMINPSGPRSALLVASSLRHRPPRIRCCFSPQFRLGRTAFCFGGTNDPAVKGALRRAPPSPRARRPPGGVSRQRRVSRRRAHRAPSSPRP